MTKLMLPLRDSYSALSRNSNQLVSAKYHAAMHLKMVLIGDAENPGVDILAALVKLKFNRQGLTNSAQQKIEQEKALATLKACCNNDDKLYGELISLARNRNSVFGMRAIPGTLKGLLNGLTDAQKQALAGKISVDEIRFLERSAVNLPTPVESNEAVRPVLISDPVQQHLERATINLLSSASDYRQPEMTASPPVKEPVSPSFHYKRADLHRRPPTTQEALRAAKSQGFRQVQRGDAGQHGAVIILGQLHNVDGLKRLPAEQREVEQSQRQILDALIDLNVKEVYVEGLIDGDEELVLQLIEAIKKDFTDYHPNMTLTEKQTEHLLFGAAFVYAALNNDVVLCATSSKATGMDVNSDMVPLSIQVKVDDGDDSDIEAEFTAPVPGWSQAQTRFLVNYREKEMGEYIQTGLAGTHKAVALVVGLGHKFDTALFWRENSPVVLRKDFGQAVSDESLTG